MENYILAGAGRVKGKEYKQQHPPISNCKLIFFPPRLGLPQWVGRQCWCTRAHSLAVPQHWDGRKREWDTNSQSLIHSAEVPKSAISYRCTDPLQQVLLCHNAKGILSNI